MPKLLGFEKVLNVLLRSAQVAVKCDSYGSPGHRPALVRAGQHHHDGRFLRVSSLDGEFVQRPLPANLPLSDDFWTNL